MLKNWRFPIFSIASLSAVGLSVTSASAQVSPSYLCYYVTDTGRVVNLESICGEPGPIDAMQSQMLQTAGGSTAQQPATEQQAAGNPPIVIVQVQGQDGEATVVDIDGQVVEGAAANEVLQRVGRASELGGNPDALGDNGAIGDETNSFGQVLEGSEVLEQTGEIEGFEEDTNTLGGETGGFADETDALDGTVDALDSDANGLNNDVGAVNDSPDVIGREDDVFRGNDTAQDNLGDNTNRPASDVRR